MGLCIVRRMPARGAPLRPAVQAILGLILTVALIAAAGATAALVLAPAALLVLTLLFGRYPGERVIHRLRRRPAPARDTGSVLIPRRAPRSLGARLSALAVPGSGRAPPALALI
jgi:hypothetical protein